MAQGICFIMSSVKALLPMSWVNVGFVACLVAGSMFAVLRLSRPGAKFNWLPVALGLPVLAIWAIAAFTLKKTCRINAGRWCA